MRLNTSRAQRGLDGDLCQTVSPHASKQFAFAGFVDTLSQLQGDGTSGSSIRATKPIQQPAYHHVLSLHVANSHSPGS
jgi:hypothetical protein